VAPSPTIPSASQGWAREAFIELVQAHAKTALVGHELQEPKLTLYPFHDIATKRTALAAALVIDVKRIDDASMHTVVVARRLDRAATPPAYFVWCGDQFLEGKLPATTQAARIQVAVRDVPMSKQGELRRDLEQAFASHDANAACDFWKEYGKSPEGGGCKHVRAVFHAMCEDGPANVLASIDDLHASLAERFYSTTAAGAVSSPFVRATDVPAALPTIEAAVTARAAAVVAIEQELRKDKVIDEILDHTGPSVVGKMPLILIGDTGWGKTESFRIIKRAGIYDEVHEMQISPGMDAMDLIGGPQKVTHRKLDGANESLVYHVDSPFVQAARAAAAGRKVAILFDELPRASRSFLSAIPAVVNPDGDTITICTGRAVPGGPDGVAAVERVTFKRSNLAIWATGNPGGNYDCNGFTDGGDLATINRFHRVYVRPDAEKAKRIIAELSGAHGWTTKATLSMTKFYINMEKLADAKDSGITRRVSLRDIGWSFDMVRGKHETMGKTLRQWTNRWTGFDLEGFPNQVQCKAVEQAIDNAFGAVK